MGMQLIGYFEIQDSTKLGLKIPRMFTAYQLSQWGTNRIGRSCWNRQRQHESTVSPSGFLAPRQGENEIVIQVSNFNHRSGGMLKALF